MRIRKLTMKAPQLAQEAYFGEKAVNFFTGIGGVAQMVMDLIARASSLSSPEDGSTS